MSFNRVDVLDALALYPDRRERGMSRAELIDELDVDPAEVNRLAKLLGHAANDGHVRKAGITKAARWFITTRGLQYEDKESWAGDKADRASHWEDEDDED